MGGCKEGHVLGSMKIMDTHHTTPPSSHHSSLPHSSLLTSLLPPSHHSSLTPLLPHTTPPSSYHSSLLTSLLPPSLQISFASLPLVMDRQPYTEQPTQTNMKSSRCYSPKTRCVPTYRTRTVTQRFTWLVARHTNAP